MNANIFNSEEFIVFTTREYANFAGTSISGASKQLTRWKNKNSIVQLTRGVWANPSHPYFNPLFCVPKLLNYEQGYVSFLTALHRYGIVSQIPPDIQVATTGHARKLKTPIGNFEFFQLKPDLCQAGVIWSETRVPYLIATAEKALLDVFYIATRKKKRFAKLPELHFSSTGFAEKAFVKLLKEANLPLPVQNAIAGRYKALSADAR